MKGRWKNKKAMNTISKKVLDPLELLEEQVQEEKVLSKIGITKKNKTKSKKYIKMQKKSRRINRRK